MCIFVCEYGEAKKATNDKTYSLKKNRFFSFLQTMETSNYEWEKNTKRNEKSVQNKNLPKYEFRNV